MNKSDKNRNKTLVHIAGSIVFFLILVIVLGYTIQVFQRKEDKYKVQEMQSLGQEVDVLLLGNSHMINGVNAAQLYREYGITSLNMAEHGYHMDESYWQLRLCLDYCVPKMVVLDVYMLEHGNRYEMEDPAAEQLHVGLDPWPLNGTKCEAIQDLLPKEVRNEFYFDFMLYHGRWAELTREDYRQALRAENEKSLLGSEKIAKTYLAPTVNYNLNMEEVADPEGVGADYLQRIIDLCREKNIQLLLTMWPINEDTQEDIAAANLAKQIAEANDIPFLNFRRNNELVNFEMDFADKGHLNSSGMYKVTTFLGNYLLQSGFVENHQSLVSEGREAPDQLSAYWQERAAYDFENDIAETQGQPNLYAELSVLQKEAVNYIIFLRANSSVYENGKAMRMIDALSPEGWHVQDANMEEPYCVLHLQTGEESRVLSGNYQTDELTFAGGNLTYIGMPDFGAFYINGDYDNNLIDEENHYEADAQIVVLDRGDGHVIETYWYADGELMED